MKKKTFVAAGLVGTLALTGAGTAAAAVAPAPEARPAQSAPADIFTATASPKTVALYAEPDINSTVVGSYSLSAVQQRRIGTIGNGGHFLEVDGGWALLS